MTHFKYAPGDQILDLTFDPPIPGVVTAPHASKSDAYHVRLDGGSNDIIIHARNLKKR